MVSLLWHRLAELKQRMIMRALAYFNSHSYFIVSRGMVWSGTRRRTAAERRLS